MDLNSEPPLVDRRVEEVWEQLQIEGNDTLLEEAYQHFFGFNAAQVKRLQDALKVVNLLFAAKRLTAQNDDARPETPTRLFRMTQIEPEDVLCLLAHPVYLRQEPLRQTGHRRALR